MDRHEVNRVTILQLNKLPLYRSDRILRSVHETLRNKWQNLIKQSNINGIFMKITLWDLWVWTAQFNDQKSYEKIMTLSTLRNWWTIINHEPYNWVMTMICIDGCIWRKCSFIQRRRQMKFVFSFSCQFQVLARVRYREGHIPPSNHIVHFSDHLLKWWAFRITICLITFYVQIIQRKPIN